jgi:transcriptional regulator with XRE-family HTH domain
LTEQGPGQRTLAEKLDRLFRTVRHNGREFTHAEVAAAVRGAEASISATYLWQLRTGRRTDPRMSHLIALARFFGVDPAYFFDEELGAQIAGELELIAALRDVGASAVAARAQGLSEATLRVIAELLDRFRELERVAAG